MLILMKFNLYFPYNFLFTHKEKMFNSSRCLAFIVPFLVLSSFLFIFIAKDYFLVPKQSRPAEPDHNDTYEADDIIPFGSDILLPIIIDGENRTALMSSDYLFYKDAVDFCKENNMSLATTPFQVQSLQGVESGKRNFSFFLTLVGKVFEASRRKKIFFYF